MVYPIYSSAPFEMKKCNITKFTQQPKRYR